jgi:hypothetical protein
VNIVTLAEGDITHLHIGFKGTMNALFLKDLAEKTHRGLRGRIEDGKSASGLCYGYRVVKTISSGNMTTGEREIEPDEAGIVERIFREFIAGVSPKQIAKNLNREGIAGPFGGPWSPSTIYGKRNSASRRSSVFLVIPFLHFIDRRSWLVLALDAPVLARHRDNRQQSRQSEGRSSTLRNGSFAPPAGMSADSR